jgi:lactobin A/cerein 7B family class IIb bacteriocin
MLDLEKFGVLEMNAQEKREVEGGIWPLVVLIVVALLVSGDSRPKK